VAELILQSLQLLLILHVGVSKVVYCFLAGCISIGKMLDAFIPALLRVLIFLCIAVKAEFSCFCRYFAAIFISQLEEVLESGEGLGRFPLPVQVGLIESLTSLDAN